MHIPKHSLPYIEFPPSKQEDDHDAHKKYPTYNDPSGETPPTVFHSRYSMPVADLHTYFLVAKGDHSYGRVRYREAEKGLGHSQDKVVVEVVMMYWQPTVQRSVRMCKLKRADGNWGFGIFVRRPSSSLATSSR